MSQVDEKCIEGFIRELMRLDGYVVDWVMKANDMYTILPPNTIERIVWELQCEHDEMVKQVSIKERLEEKVISIARKMLRRGTPIEVVVEDTGLDESIIRQLHKEYVLKRQAAKS